MIRRVLLLLFCLSGSAHAQDGGFDGELLARVQTEAIDFMLPRTLEAVSAAQLAVWGLGGLTAIDAGLTVTAPRDGRLRLLVQGRIALDLVTAGADTAAWGRLSAQVVAAGFAGSRAMRQAGTQSITQGLFDEMLGHLDPYSRYVPPFAAGADRARRVGRAGIGVELVQRGRSVVVRESIIGSPAALVGIASGDVILEVDGISAVGRDQSTIGALLNGPEGTTVNLAWQARGGMFRGAKLTRIMVPPETVFSQRQADTLILRISGFSQSTDLHVAHEVQEALKPPRPVTGIVLDLRGNRGGLLLQAVATADLFLPAGVVVRSVGRAAEANRIWVSVDGELAPGVRLIVLVDGGTASAAEVLAAALADRGRAVVAGSATFGKGLVQTIDPLPDGGELFLTWSRLLAPRGWPIQSLGVLPQVCTSLGEEALTRQLAALASGQPAMGAAVKSHRAARPPVTPDQIVAIRGQCPASDSREGDLAVAAGLAESAASYTAALLEPMTAER